jgi:hypothetical protein
MTKRRHRRDSFVILIFLVSRARARDKKNSAHGAWRLVEAAMAAKEVPAGQSWVFRDHRTMAEVIAAEAG